MEGYSLKKFFRSPIPVKYLPYTLLGLSILGFFDAAYLTILHYKNVIPPCTIGGCEVVLTSKYAMVGPFPTSLYGVAFYVAVIILTGILLSLPNVIANKTRRFGEPSPKSGKQSSEAKEIAASVAGGEPPRNDGKKSMKLAHTITLLLFILCLSGLAVGLFLVYLQAFVLHSFCQYCLASEVIDFLMFDTAWWLYNSRLAL